MKRKRSDYNGAYAAATAAETGRSRPEFHAPSRFSKVDVALRSSVRRFPACTPGAAPRPPSSRTARDHRRRAPPAEADDTSRA